ncbi:hypothetical protein [Sedimenticola selenatireducens]|uniref:GDPGP1-like N-terminal domain-containing protein n=1 Tax=Sedimenticola selenatireducens TaxID=191960 RepID=A0A558DV62_9GAMM|nr:hypothetical protein [Sedimenticola selenatireducens]TVO72529.1 hypothetical protein FHP88_13140 [Sedimenticola selenatireducens]TVT64783.1 MAG: hypothetical protein FHK78_06905 [Sedimenticola selenatireducens]
MTEIAHFDSVDAYQEAFVSGLRVMLQGYDELGVFILVLANAMIDPETWDALSGPLQTKFARLSSFHAGSLDDAKDDRMVFQQLIAFGFDKLGPIRLREAGPWEVQFNPLRALRPARLIQQQVQGISAPFNPDEFHFAKPFLRKEIFWRGKLVGRDVSLLYNKFPFVQRLGLLVLEPREGRPQFLQRADHDYSWRLLDQLGRTLPGVGLGYNSFAAFASVNHLHFHLFIRDALLPIAADLWQHNGGGEPYPASCTRFTSSGAAWEYLQDLHGRKIPYNLVMYPGVLYVLPRLRQGERSIAPWSGGYGWYEMAGGCVPQGEQYFSRLTELQLADELRAVSVMP